jgi:FkbM family methyltransferase
MQAIKHWIRRTLRHFHLEVRKFPRDSPRALPILDLALLALMAKKGSAIRFIQVGANDGVHVDPLRKYVTSLPWTGVLVEPQPDVFERLRDNYEECASRLIFENCGVSQDRRVLELFRLSPDAQTSAPSRSAVVSYREDMTASQLLVPKSRLQRITVPCVTLDELIGRHGMGDLDLLQIDTEGYDLQVLRSLDLERTKPRVIHIETGHLTRPDCTELASLLSSNGYLIHWGGHQSDTVAMHSSCLEWIGSLSELRPS